MATKAMIEVDGRSYDADTVGNALLDVRYERVPVGIMSKWQMRDGIIARLRWACGTVSLIPSHYEAPDDVKDAASSANMHLEQALAMFRELLERERTAPDPELEPDQSETTEGEDSEISFQAS